MDCKVKSVRCGVWSVRSVEIVGCAVWSVEWGLGNVKCGVGIGECKVWSVECDMQCVLGLEYGVWSMEWKGEIGEYKV